MKKYQRIISILPAGYGHYRVTIERRGRWITGITTDSQAYDAYHSHERGWKQAGDALYDEIVAGLITGKSHYIQED